MSRTVSIDEMADAINEGLKEYATLASTEVKKAVRKSAKTVKEQIIANTGGLCTEMEGAAIAQTAYRNGVPFVILRAISDKADDSAEMDYPTFERIAAHRCAAVTQGLARQLKEAEEI